MRGKRKIIKNLSRIIVFIVGIAMMAMSLTALAYEYPAVPDSYPEAVEVEYEIYASDNSREDDDEPYGEAALELEGTTPAPAEGDAEVVATLESIVPLSGTPSEIGGIMVVLPFPWWIPQHSTFDEIVALGPHTIILLGPSPGYAPLGELRVTADMLSNLDTSIAGDSTITITLVVGDQSFSITHPVEVDAQGIICDCLTPSVELHAISLGRYFIGTPLENAGMIFWTSCGICGNFIGNATGAAVTEDMICSFPSNTPGPHNLTLTYQEMTTTVEVYFVAPNLGQSPILYFPVASFFLFPGDTIECLDITGLLKAENYSQACADAFWCFCTDDLCVQVFTITTEMAIAGGFDPRLRGPQEVEIEFFGATITITLEVLGPPVCICPPGCCGPNACCGDESCCGIELDCLCVCRCRCPECDRLLRQCICCAICDRFPSICRCPDCNQLLRDCDCCDCPPCECTECECKCICQEGQGQDPDQNLGQGQNQGQGQANVTTGAAPKTGDVTTALPLLAGFLLSMSSVLGGTSLRKKLKK